VFGLFLGAIGFGVLSWLLFVSMTYVPLVVSLGERALDLVFGSTNPSNEIFRTLPGIIFAAVLACSALSAFLLPFLALFFVFAWWLTLAVHVDRVRARPAAQNTVVPPLPPSPIFRKWIRREDHWRHSGRTFLSPLVAIQDALSTAAGDTDSKNIGNGAIRERALPDLDIRGADVQHAPSSHLGAPPPPQTVRGEGNDAPANMPLNTPHPSTHLIRIAAISRAWILFPLLIAGLFWTGAGLSPATQDAWGWYGFFLGIPGCVVLALIVGRAGLHFRYTRRAHFLLLGWALLSACLFLNAFFCGFQWRSALLLTASLLITGALASGIDASRQDSSPSIHGKDAGTSSHKSSHIGSPDITPNDP